VAYINVELYSGMLLERLSKTRKLQSQENRYQIHCSTPTCGVKIFRYRQSSDPVTSTCLAKMLL
jgi:hypothetical protein